MGRETHESTIQKFNHRVYNDFPFIKMIKWKSLWTLWVNLRYLTVVWIDGTSNISLLYIRFLRHIKGILANEKSLILMSIKLLTFLFKAASEKTIISEWASLKQLRLGFNTSFSKENILSAAALDGIGLFYCMKSLHEWFARKGRRVW